MQKKKKTPPKRCAPMKTTVEAFPFLMTQVVSKKLMEIILIFDPLLSLEFNHDLTFTATLSQLLSKALNID